MSPDAMLQSGLMAVQAATLSDAEVRSMSDQACAEMDAEANISGPNNPYSKRLDKIVNNLGHQINGTPITYKVYQADDVNAWAMANGCARVYSGLMDLMTDNEVEGVLGHEIGHVALGHTNVEAAEEMGIGAETVKSYLRSVMRKLGAHTRYEAVNAARRIGALP